MVRANKDKAKKQLGRISEELAVRWLEKKGFQVLAKNFVCKIGEVDIVAVKDKVLYVVEVRSRRVSGQVDVGMGLASVGKSKQMKLKRLAEYCNLAFGGKHGGGSRGIACGQFADRNILIIEVNWYNSSRAKIRMIPFW